MRSARSTEVIDPSAISLVPTAPAAISADPTAFVAISSNPTEFEGAQGFLRNLPKYGYIEGQNTTLIKVETKDKAEIKKTIRNMVAKKVDLIFSMTTPATKMAKKITQGSDTPVVFILYDAISSGVAESLLTHKGNLTGIQLRGSTPKSLEKLLEIAPDTKHILTPVCFDTGAAKKSLEDLKNAAHKLGLQLSVAEVNTVAELRSAMQSMPEDIDAIFILHTWLVGTNLEPIIAESIKRKIPLPRRGKRFIAGGVSPRKTDTHKPKPRRWRKIVPQHDTNFGYDFRR